ncbi:DUF4445 domain-containing protein [Chloroflexi bacterium TSY]|nr:DUF4445 domain-containing protein [Chloroflexi bacterium TSY]
MSHRIIFQPLGRQGDIVEGTTLLDAARQMGVEIESICGGRQTCGKCKIVVEEGEFVKFGIASRMAHLSEPEEREQQYASRRDFTPDERLSCACQVEGPLVIRVPEESQMRKQVVRKAIGFARSISVNAVMRLYYVELPPAELKDHRGDWQRLQDELRSVHHLDNLQIDPLILRTLQPALSRANRAITVTVWRDQKVVQIRSGFQENLYGIAIDVGTTTIAGHLCHLRTGDVLATASRMNPQVPYGEDLMSRVSYAMMNEDGTDRMHRAVIEGLNEIIADVAAQAKIEPLEIIEMVVVANTTMHHLILGVNPVELGGAPFSLVTHDAVDIKARDLGIHLAPGANIHIPPCEAGHVGADNVGVLVAEAPYHQDKQMLVIDIGTNGELLLGNDKKLLSASSPTGPAFEGAQILHGMRAADGAIERVRIDPATLDVRFKMIGKDEWIKSSKVEIQHSKSDTQSLQARHQSKREAILNPPLRASGICGSGIIEAVAELFVVGLLAPNGRLVEIEHPRLRTGLGDGGGKAEFILAYPHETSTGEAIVVHSDDIRAIQLAKAALYAGAKLLMNRMQRTSVDRIVLAGGFGSYIDPKYAMILGLIPDCSLDSVHAVGNAAGDGARMILLDREKREEARWAARWVTYIETAVEPTFQEEFVGAIHIPHATDPFPHLASLLADAKQKWSPERLTAIDAMVGDTNRGRASREERAARRARRQRVRA